MVNYLAYHIGGNEVPSVNDRGVRCYHLERGHLVGLSERTGRKLNGTFLAGVDVNAVRLAGQVYARRFGEAVCLEVVEKFILAQKLSYLDKGRVAGVCHSRGEVLRTVGIIRPAVDIGVRDGYYLSAVKCGVKAYGFFFQSRRTRYYLEYGAGVVQLGDSLVLPLLLTECYVKLVVLVLIDDARKLRRICGIIEGVPVVQVEAGGTCHCLDRSGFSLHDYGAGAVLNVVSLHLLLKVFFRVVLQGHVQR